jgi:chromate reductase, NAD(P)H dehydrogenase (quinone)
MKKNTIKILAISGSLRNSSSNTNLIRAASAIAQKEKMIFTIYGGLGDLPHFNPDLDGDEPPATVTDLRKQIKAADGVLICTPEYANGVPGVLKNALDWIVSSGEFVNKPTAVISASPLATGGKNAHDSLLLTLKMMTAAIVEGGTMNIPLVSKKLSPEGELMDTATAYDLGLMLDALAKAIH